MGHFTLRREDEGRVRMSTGFVTLVIRRKLTARSGCLRGFRGRCPSQPAAHTRGWPCSRCGGIRSHVDSIEALGNADRFVRFAARTALEHQPSRRLGCAGSWPRDSASHGHRGGDRIGPHRQRLRIIGSDALAALERSGICWICQRNRRRLLREPARWC